MPLMSEPERLHYAITRRKEIETRLHEVEILEILRDRHLKIIDQIIEELLELGDKVATDAEAGATDGAAARPSVAGTSAAPFVPQVHPSGERNKSAKVTEAERAAMLKEFKDGMSTLNIGKKFDRSVPCVIANLKKAGASFEALVNVRVG